MVKVGFLLSYDYEYVKYSLPCVYKYADAITFSIDINRISWSGNTFDFDESILDWIRAYDIDKKIKIYQDDFYIKSNTALQNDTYQRNKMVEFMGNGGWHLQIDVDEYFIKFKEFVAYLNTLNHYLISPEKHKIAITAVLLNLFKQDESGFYYIKESVSTVRIATNFPVYANSRYIPHRQIFTPFIVVHQSWARPEKEVFYKLQNWGHKNDFDTQKYFQLWKNVNKNNYFTIHNFYPVKPYSAWDSLKYAPYKDAAELMENIDQLEFKISNWHLLKKNAIQFFLKNNFLNTLYHKKIYNTQI